MVASDYSQAESATVCHRKQTEVQPTLRIRKFEPTLASLLHQPVNLFIGFEASGRI